MLGASVHLLFFLAALQLPCTVAATGKVVQKKQLVVACNGFADGEPATLGVRQDSPAPVTGLRRFYERSQQRINGQRVKHQLGTKPVLKPAPAALSFSQLPGSHSLRTRRLRVPGGTFQAAGSHADAGSRDAHSLRTRYVHGGTFQASGSHEDAGTRDAHSLHSHIVHAPGGTFHPAGSDANADGDVVVWTRQLAYGECEEYHIDLAKRRFFFTTPDGLETCEFEPPDLENSVGMTQQFLVVFSQHEASSSLCMAHSAEVKKFAFKKSGSEKSVQLATVDAFTQAPVVQGSETQEEAEMSFRDAKRGLQPLQPLPQEAVVRIEDKIGNEAISSEVLASQTLGWGHSYALEPGSFHVLLEDMRGSRMPDWKDVFFKEGCTYIAVRIGKAGDAMYPERLIVRRIEDAMPLFSH